ncbi:helix-turn-helix domain-containing protein [Azospirillum himalayense]|uniref:Multiprotein-bridging factor 1 family protein n=1 Tax=Azospirillum himalayense TaxID=654847 RepID=A0ABW0GFS6_9PROT
MLTASQVRAARGLIDWSQKRLQEETGLSATTIKRMENDVIGPGKSTADNVEKVMSVLRAAGVEFLDDGEPSKAGGPGVRLRMTSSST